MEAVIYKTTGVEAGKLKLPETIFGLPKNDDLVHQVVVSMLSSERNPVAHTKSRGEVSGGGKKPWQQKGTGRARHGSIRSPIWKGGGVAHGPRNDKNYDRKVNKKMKVAALYTILSQKFRDGEIIFVDTFAFDTPKTASAVKILGALGKASGTTLAVKKKNAALITVGQKDAMVEKSFRNIGTVEVDEVRNLNPVTILQYKYLVIANPTESMAFIEGKRPVTAKK